MSRRLLLSYLSLALFVLLLLEIPLAISYERSQHRELITRLERDAVAMASFAEDTLERRLQAAPALVELADGYRRETGGRAVIVGRDGLAVLDTDPPERGSRSFASRPEIARALRGSVATGVRHSDTLSQDLVYVAVPVSSSGAVYGAVRLTYPAAEVERRIRRYWLLLTLIGAIVLATTGLVAILLTRTVSRPLLALERATAAAGAGELAARAPVAGPPEVRSLAMRFNDMAAKLEALLAAQHDFVADASHQLRTPLAALRLRLENLRDDLAPTGGEDLEGALAEVERLSRLVGSLLTLARADESGPGAEILELDALVAGRLEFWSPLAAEQSVSLARSVAPGLHARGTRGRLEQVLDNLIENGLEHSPAGSTIAVSAALSGSSVELHVTDEGPGMSDASRRRAFDRFWRQGSDGGGSGLGLAIVRKLVEADGGSVELGAAASGGLDVLIRLPAASAGPAPRSGT